MAPRAIVVPPGKGTRYGNVELEEGAVAAPPGTFVLVPPGVPHAFTNHGSTPVRMFNIHAPAGFDERIARG